MECCSGEHKTLLSNIKDFLKLLFNVFLKTSNKPRTLCFSICSFLPSYFDIDHDKLTYWMITQIFCCTIRFRLLLNIQGPRSWEAATIGQNTLGIEPWVFVNINPTARIGSNHTKQELKIESFICNIIHR